MTFPVSLIRKIRSRATRRKASVELIILVIQICALYWILLKIHTETYVLQCTLLGDFLRPVRRLKCSLIPHALDDFNGDGKRKYTPSSTNLEATGNNVGNLRYDADLMKNTSVQNSYGEEMIKGFHSGISSGRKRKLRIAMLYLYDGSNSGGNGNDGGESWTEPLMMRVLRNRKEYCSRHGYTMVNANHLVDKSRPAAWSKLKAVDYILSERDTLAKKEDPQSSLLSDINQIRGTPKDINGSISKSNDNTGDIMYSYDYVMYIDMDVIIMDLNRPLDDFILAAGVHDSIAVTEGEDGATIKKKVEFLMTEDWNGEFLSR